MNDGSDGIGNLASRVFFFCVRENLYMRKRIRRTLASWLVSLARTRCEGECVCVCDIWQWFALPGFLILCGLVHLGLLKCSVL